jgi:hypothetical protein
MFLALRNKKDVLDSEWTPMGSDANCGAFLINRLKVWENSRGLEEVVLLFQNLIF